MLVVAFLGGCSTGGEDTDPRPVQGAPKEVAQVIARLERGVASRDFAAVCDLFASDTRERAGGKACAKFMKVTADEVSGASIRILNIRIESDGATARVRTQADGQAPVDETIELVREDGRYLIAALGG